MTASDPPDRPRAITVYCASSKRCPQVYMDVAAGLGHLLAQRDYTLIYGGGNTGLMGALSRSTLAAGGQVVGVILTRFLEDGSGQAGHEMHTADDMRSRKQGLDERGDAFIALPGGFGTFEEVLEVIALKQLGFHSKPIVLVNTNGYFDGLLQQFERGFAEALINQKFRGLYTAVSTPQQALTYIEQELGHCTASPSSGE